MLFFIVWLGNAVQCNSVTGCVVVPYEAIAYMIQFGILEMFAEIGVYKYYRKTIKKKEK